jgi:Tfp pilus assembly protein PilZ
MPQLKFTVVIIDNKAYFLGTEVILMLERMKFDKDIISDMCQSALDAHGLNERKVYIGCKTDQQQCSECEFKNEDKINCPMAITK